MFTVVLFSLVGGIGVGSFLAAVIAQLNGRDRRRRVVDAVRPTLISIQKGFKPTRPREGGREKMDGGKKRTRSMAHALTHSLQLALRGTRVRAAFLGLNWACESKCGQSVGEPGPALGLDERLLEERALGLCARAGSFSSGESRTSRPICTTSGLEPGKYFLPYLVDGPDDSKPALTAIRVLQPLLFCSRPSEKPQEGRTEWGRRGGGIWAKIPCKGGNLYIHPSIHMPLCGPALTR